MAEELLVTMEDGTQAQDLTVFGPVKLIDAFNIHAEFIEGIVGLLHDAADSPKSKIPYPLAGVLFEAEDRLKMLSALAEEMGRRLGVKNI